jgi:hypothetical protein
MNDDYKVRAFAKCELEDLIKERVWQAIKQNPEVSYSGLPEVTEDFQVKFNNDDEIHLTFFCIDVELWDSDVRALREYLKARDYFVDHVRKVVKLRCYGLDLLFGVNLKSA